MIQPHATDETVAKVLALHATGHTYTEIQRLANVSDSTITRWTHGEVSKEITERRDVYVQEMRSSSLSKFARAVDKRIDEHLDGEKAFTDQQLLVGYGILTDKEHQSKQGAPPPKDWQYVIVRGNVTVTETRTVTIKE